MAIKYTEEQLNQFDKTTLVQLFLATQEQLDSIDAKLQLVLEQLAVSNNKRFGNEVVFHGSLLVHVETELPVHGF